MTYSLSGGGVTALVAAVWKVFQLLIASVADENKRLETLNTKTTAALEVSEKGRWNAEEELSSLRAMNRALTAESRNAAAKKEREG